MKIQKLPYASELRGDEVLPVVQDGATKKTSVKSVRGVMPDDIALDDDVLQLTADGKPVGEGVTLPKPTIDSELDENSENAIANKAVAEGLKKVEDKIPAVDTTLSSESKNPLENRVTALEIAAAQERTEQRVFNMFKNYFLNLDDMTGMFEELEIVKNVSITSNAIRANSLFQNTTGVEKIILTLPNALQLNSAFRGCPDLKEITLIGDNFSNCGSVLGYTMKYRNDKLETINLPNLSKCTVFGIVICPNLKHVIIPPNCIHFNVEFQYCSNLTVESLQNLIDALVNFSDDTSGTQHLFKIGSLNMAKLTDEQIQIVINKGWQIS